MGVATALGRVIAAAREAVADTYHIPACAELAKALYEYDDAREALCRACDGAGSVDSDECDRGEGPSCSACNGTGLIETTAQDARCVTTPDGGCVGVGCMHDVKE
jgi:hypothetical protein